MGLLVVPDPKLRSGSFGVLTVSFFTPGINDREARKLLLRLTDSHPVISGRGARFVSGKKRGVPVWGIKSK